MANIFLSASGCGAAAAWLEEPKSEDDGLFSWGFELNKPVIISLGF